MFSNCYLRCKLEFSQSSFILLGTVLVLTWLHMQGKQYTEISNTDWAVLQVRNRIIITIYYILKCMEYTNHYRH
jgi:hypothetical protein